MESSGMFGFAAGGTLLSGLCSYVVYSPENKRVFWGSFVLGSAISFIAERYIQQMPAEDKGREALRGLSIILTGYFEPMVTGSVLSVFWLLTSDKYQTLTRVMLIVVMILNPSLTRAISSTSRASREVSRSVTLVRAIPLSAFSFGYAATQAVFSAIDFYRDQR